MAIRAQHHAQEQVFERTEAVPRLVQQEDISLRCVKELSSSFRRRAIVRHRDLASKAEHSRKCRIQAASWGKLGFSKASTYSSLLSEPQHSGSHLTAGCQPQTMSSLLAEDSLDLESIR